MRKSMLAATVVAMVVATLSPAAALAKFPPFSVELQPESPRAGQPIRVVVHTWEDTAHTQVADWGIPSPLEGLLTLYRAADAESGAYTGMGGLEVSLEETATGEWSATLPALEVGSWVLRPFPGSSGGDPPPAGYPGDMRFTITSPSASTGTYVLTTGGATARLVA